MELLGWTLGLVALILIVVCAIGMIVLLIYIFSAIFKYIGMRMAGVKFVEDDSSAENGSFYNENGDWIG